MELGKDRTNHVPHRPILIRISAIADNIQGAFSLPRAIGEGRNTYIALPAKVVLLITRTIPIVLESEYSRRRGCIHKANTIYYQYEISNFTLKHV
eukprot:scaffold3263_cov239-Chaetoceros_neogracile.AAC.2